MIYRQRLIKNNLYKSSKHNKTVCRPDAKRTQKPAGTSKINQSQAKAQKQETRESQKMTSNLQRKSPHRFKKSQSLSAKSNRCASSETFSTKMIGK